MNQYSPHKNASKRVGILVVGVTSLFSMLVIALLFAIGENEPEQKMHTKSEDIIELLETTTPEPITSTLESNESIGLELPQGGWVQQTDAFGNLSQQYRCESLDPNPPDLPTGWIEMQKPEVEIFLSDNNSFFK